METVVKIARQSTITYIFALIAVITVILLPTSVARAEPTCEFSGKNGTSSYDSTDVVDGSKHYSGTLTYSGGNCILTKPDTAKGGTTFNVDGKCPSSKPLSWQGKCYQARAEYTNAHPTESDGSAIGDNNWQTICSRVPSGALGGYHYLPDRHRCESDSACYWLASDVGSIDGDCTAFSDSGNSVGGLDSVGYKTPQDIQNKTNDCKAAKISMDPQTHECNWTKETCSKKNSSARKDGGNGYWDASTNACKAYSDFPSAEECAKLTPPGEWQQDPTNSAHYECVKPGGKIQTDAAKNADPNTTDCPRNAEGKCATVQGPTGTCGAGSDGTGVKTNIIGCETGKDQGGSTAISNLLRIFVIVLSVGVGIAALGGLAYSAVQYAGASDSESNVSAAKERIRNIVIGLILYGFLLVIINWLLPGGVIQ